MLTALLVQSTRIRGGLMVTANTFRHPALLAKMVTTLDIISGGRVEVGLGAGWFEAEHHQYGLDLPPIGERMRRLEESCRILEALWTEKRATVEGTYYAGARRVSRAEAACSSRTRRSRSARAASRSDSGSPRVTRRHGTWRARRPRSSVASPRCSTATAARSAGTRAEIERSIQFLPEAMDGDIVASAREFIAAGATHLIFSCPTPYSAAGARTIWTEVVARLR